MKYLFLIAWHQLAYCLLHAGLIASACGIPALQLLIAPPLLAPQHCAGFTTGIGMLSVNYLMKLS